jgi:hypothetical protein
MSNGALLSKTAVMSTPSPPLAPVTDLGDATDYTNIYKVDQISHLTNLNSFIVKNEMTQYISSAIYVIL